MNITEVEHDVMSMDALTPLIFKEPEGNKYLHFSTCQNQY